MGHAELDGVAIGIIALPLYLKTYKHDLKCQDVSSNKLTHHYTICWPDGDICNARECTCILDCNL